MTAITAQLILSWDGQRLLCEAPGAGGSTRQKFDIGGFADLPPALRAALDTILSERKDAAARAFRQQQAQNIQYVASRPGMGLDFAKQIWPADAIEQAEQYGLKFSQALRRLHNTDSAASAASKPKAPKLSTKLTFGKLTEIGL